MRATKAVHRLATDGTVKTYANGFLKTAKSFAISASLFELFTADRKKWIVIGVEPRDGWSVVELAEKLN